jgi:hypothetical protein
MWGLVALVRADVSQERIDSIFTVKRISERSVVQFLVTAKAVPSSLIIFNLMMEGYVPPKLRFSQEPHGITSQKAEFFIATADKTSNLT